MSFLEPQLIQIQSFTVVGLNERTKNENEFNPDTAKLPCLWERFHTQHIANHSTPSIFGVYSNYDSDATGFYTVTAGVEMDNNIILPNLSSVTVQSGNYLRFENQGPMPQAIIETWQQIWLYFSSQPQFTRTYDTDFEIYDGPEKCAVHIGIK
ncbi:GyrI-like domain-containing protein [Legionella brunensis]|uniref:Transcription activator n=1 Tax=Legionella brunensis TaxID=29422 RepID=A0A0W0ST64_9GAMM|nr:GyrI-like domain-containing protein [Legionella brunensis]KTC86449.1 Transcription activator [Legionella brunensis]